MIYPDDDSDEIIDDTDQIASLNSEEQAILISHGNSDANKDSIVMFQQQREGFTKDFLVSKSQDFVPD